MPIRNAAIRRVGKLVVNGTRKAALIYDSRDVARCALINRRAVGAQ